ncbi:hypothetical protein KP509_02G100200 [Ceratopteris richardii]|uniref:Uncharacterized protein n=1 Tax=Ceratopteris richardii TaxID=49495 RepID=A0A8T2VGI1_CERRI|nr:hypothetical protein KP509_02G100200 [Ceratopteris richardii]
MHTFLSANFHRIKRAFKLGARQLAQVFETIDEDFPKCLDDFFSNTWERHQSGHRPDAPESFFPPYEKFVYKSGYLDMLGDPGAEYLLKVPEVGNSIPSSVEKIIRNEKIIASRLESRMQNMVSKSSECIRNRDPPIKHSKSLKEIPDDEVSEVCRQETDVLSVFHSGYPRQEISNNMQSTVMYSMALAANADFQLKMSSHNKGCLEKAQSVVPSQRSLAAASRETVVSENRIETSVDEIMKASDCPRNMKKFNVLRRTSSHGHLPISYGPVDDCNSAQVIRAGKYNFSEVSSSQETCRQGSMSHTQESREWSTVRRAALDTSSCRAEDSIMAKVSTGGKTHSILLTESSDMQYAAGMLPALPPVLSASSSSTVVSSQFTCPSMSAQIESETKRLSYSSSEQNEPCSLHSLDSGKLPLDDGQKITRSAELGKLPDLEIYSQHQLLEEGEQLQYPQKLEQHPKTSNVNLEEPQHLFSTCGSINPGVQKNDDVSGILGGLNVSAPMKMEECMKSVELNQKTKSSRREFSHTDSRTRKKAVRYKAPEVLPAMCVTKATTSGLNQGLSSKGGSGIQQPINFRDASQSVVFGATVTKMHPAQEGEKCTSQGHMSYFPPIPIISYQNTIYNTFPVSSFSPNVQHKYKTSIDGISRGSSPFRYQNSRQLSEPMAAALSARFASLSIEDNGLECQHDLLRSDLYNHLRNLEVGRLCQEPFQQTLLEPPYSCQNAQDFSLWNFIPSMPQASASNQMIGKFKGPFYAMPFPHSVGSIPCFKSDRNASGFSQLCGQETRRTSMSLVLCNYFPFPCLFFFIMSQKKILCRETPCLKICSLPVCKTHFHEINSQCVKEISLFRQFTHQQPLLMLKYHSTMMPMMCGQIR